MALFLILPTRGEGANRYRGKRPTFPRSVSAGATGLHVELNNGLRLWAAPGFGPAELPKLDSDFAHILAESPAMTAEQYAALCEAAELLRARPTKRDLAASMARRIPGMAAPAEAARVDSGLFDPLGGLRGTGELVPAETESREVTCVTVTNADDGAFRIAAEDANGFPTQSIEYAPSHAEAERAARRMAARFEVSIVDSTREGWQALESAREAERAARAERETVRRNLRLQAEGMAEIARKEQQAKNADTLRVIDMTPTWAGILPALRALIENSNSQGRATAWAELERMAALADERNLLAERIEAAAELARGTRGGFDPTGNGPAAIDAILSALAGAETISGKAS